MLTKQFTLLEFPDLGMNERSDKFILPADYVKVQPEPHYKGDGAHSVHELQELCRQYKERCHQQAIIKQSLIEYVRGVSGPSLLWKDLNGTNAVIICRGATEQEAVDKICGYGLSVAWYNGVCIECNSVVGAKLSDCIANGRYVIEAADFIAANRPTNHL